ncbi:20S proteasome subunit alpha 6 [Angomonas deanei]|nr:20S proteasome subunit alpha 6 [Angomonas deanei]|eukprot:EPY43551.1 20S proteasome subunit alpha 6 [Angomonas deanei]
MSLSKNDYDTDISTWSPSGRLFQLEYANEAANNGSATVGVKGKDHVVLVALKRSPVAELSSYQEKVFLIDEHVGLSISGLVADGRVLARFLRTECMNYRYLYDSALPLPKMADILADKHQKHIQSAAKRPFGVGLLIGGYDRQGPHLFQTIPSGDVFDFKASAMGVRSQSSRTYLEKHFATFTEVSLDDLILHALKALASATPEGVELTIQNTTIAVVGKDTPFTVLNEENSRKYLDGFKLNPEDRVVVNEEDEDETLQEQPLDIEE